MRTLKTGDDYIYIGQSTSHEKLLLQIQKHYTAIAVQLFLTIILMQTFPRVLAITALSKLIWMDILNTVKFIQ